MAGIDGLLIGKFSIVIQREAGTIICDYPEGTEKPKIPVPYCEETMTGFEYAFAGLLCSRGRADDGVKVVKSIRDRFDGEKRNPWNEFENYLQLFDIPIVAVGNRVNSLSYVGIDDFAAMREMTEKVLKGNPQNIIYFSPALDYPGAYAQRSRYEGFLSIIGKREYTVVKDIDDIRECYNEKTTIICSNDYYALQVYFKSKNVKIVGFDNIRAIDKYKLSVDSVGYSMSEIANAAVDIIRHNGKESVIVKHFIAERN